MTRATHRVATAILVTIACALPAGSAQAAIHDNVANATIEQDDGRAFDFSWDVGTQRGGVVDAFNSARAAARCVRCKATAIAFQIVLVSGTPSGSAPINEAVALNQGCTECTAVAEARQFVRVVDSPATVSRGGRAELADVRQDLRALELQDLPIDQLHAAVEEQEARVRAVLADALVLKADSGTEADVLDRWLVQDSDLG